MSRQRLAILLGLIVGLGACLPLPHYQHFYPQLSGTVVRNKQPLKGIEIRVQHNNATNDCAAPNQRATTNAAGHFAFQPDDELLFFMIFGDRKDFWTVCAHEPNGRVHSWRSEGYWGGPKQQRINCTLTTEPKEQEINPLDMACTVNRGEAQTRPPSSK